MKNFTMDYVNENGKNMGYVEVGFGDVYIVHLPDDNVLLYGTVCNTGLLSEGYFEIGDLNLDEALQGLVDDLWLVEHEEKPSSSLVQYFEG